jgi:hypothetical protein
MPLAEGKGRRVRRPVRVDACALLGRIGGRVVSIGWVEQLYPAAGWLPDVNAVGNSHLSQCTSGNGPGVDGRREDCTHPRITSPRPTVSQRAASWAVA